MLRTCSAMRATLPLLVVAACVAAEPHVRGEPVPLPVHTRLQASFETGTPDVVLPDLSGTWAVAGTGDGDVGVGPSPVLSLYRHQPGRSAAAAPNSVYTRELGGSPRGHCWLTPFYGYDTRLLQRVELTCDGGDSGYITTATTNRGLVINGETWARQSATPATHNTTIHTVHMIYMNHYDVGKCDPAR